MTESRPSREVAPIQEFRIQQWEVWYVYSFYLSQSIPDLEAAGHQIASSGLMRGLVTPSGRLGWREGGSFKMTPPAESDTHRSRNTAIQFLGHVSEELRLPIFKLLARRSAERHVFGVTAEVPEPSLRVLLPDFTVVHPSGRTLTLEVTAQIFQQGIVLLSLQASVEMDVSLKEFIHDHVNLSELDLRQVHTSPDIGFLLFCATTADVPSESRWSIFKDRKTFERSLQRELAPDEEPDSRKTILTPEESNHLPGVAQLIVRALAYALGKPRVGIRFLLLGEPKHPRWTGIWHGSPHIHLIRFSGQSASAKANEDLWHDAFKCITSRISPAAGPQPKILLPANLRVLDDHGVYVAESAILWAYTTDKGAPEVSEHNGGKALYFPTSHNQVKGELIEYGHALYTSMLDELSFSRDFDWDKVLGIKERQLLFERELSLSGQFGEVRDLLREAFRVRRLDELRQHAASLISLRETSASVIENRRLASTAIVIAFIVSFLGLGDAVDFTRWAVKPHIPVVRSFGQGTLIESAALGLLVLVLLALFSWLVHVVLRRRRFISWRTAIRR